MTLTRSQVRAFYDRLGAKLDWCGSWVDPAIGDLLSNAAFEAAGAVFELGCGTGRLAERLLDRILPPQASYTGIDLSPTMIDLARRRLRRFGDRAAVHLTDGAAQLDVDAASCDRFLCTYVLDLLEEAQIRAVIDEAHRVLSVEGLLGVVSLCPGVTLFSRMVTGAWARLNAARPALLGGCRPIELLKLLPEEAWAVRHTRTISRCGVPSQVIVAAKVER